MEPASSGAQQSTAATSSAAAAASGPLEECPICLEAKRDVQQLPHKSGSGDISQHRACAQCREQLVGRNAPCPWCRTEMVWQTTFGFLGGLKRGTRGFMDGQHNELAGLMATWQEYEMCRTESDIKLFAKEMSTDPAIVARLNGAIARRSGWLRDSIGLWIRFYAMYADGEIEISPDDGARLQRAVETGIEVFKENHGGHPHFLGAIYQQSAVATLCANTSGLSNRTLAKVTKDVGEAVMHVWQKHYGRGRRREVKERLTQDYALAVSEVVWGDLAADPIMRTFFFS